MAKYSWDHVHLRTTDPEATAQWYERMLGAEVIRTMQQGKPRIDLKLGGANIFIAPVTAGDGVNPPPATPYQGLDHLASPSSASMLSPPSSRPRAWSSRASQPPCVRGYGSASSAHRKGCRSSFWSAIFRRAH